MTNADSMFTQQLFQAVPNPTSIPNPTTLPKFRMHCISQFQTKGDHSLRLFLFLINISTYMTSAFWSTMDCGPSAYMVLQPVTVPTLFREKTICSYLCFCCYVARNVNDFDLNESKSPISGPTPSIGSCNVFARIKIMKYKRCIYEELVHW